MKAQQNEGKQKVYLNLKNRHFFLESMNNLNMILKHKDATTQIIKDAHVELKAQLDQCKEVQRELVTLVGSTELSTVTKWLSDLKVKLTSTCLDR